MKRKKTSFIKVFVVILVLILVPILAMDKIAGFLVYKYAGCRIEYSGSIVNVLFGGSVSDLKIESDRTGLIIYSDTAMLKMKPTQSIRKKRMVMVLDALFLSVRSNKAYATFPGNLLESEITLKKAGCEFSMGENDLLITSLYAESDDVHIYGDIKYINISGEISVDMDMEFSPGYTDSIRGKYKGKVLTERENGWFGMDLVVDADPSSSKYHMKTRLKDTIVEFNVRGE
jgi:hypothetical protein